MKRKLERNDFKYHNIFNNLKVFRQLKYCSRFSPTECNSVIETCENISNVENSFVFDYL